MECSPPSYLKGQSRALLKRPRYCWVLPRTRTKTCQGTPISKFARSHAAASRLLHDLLVVGGQRPEWRSQHLKILLTPPPSETEWGQDPTYRKDERDTSPYSLRAIQVSLGAKEEILLALAFPGNNGGAIQKYFDRFACR